MKMHSPAVGPEESCTILPNKEDAKTRSTTTQQQEPSPQKENLNTADNDDAEPSLQQEKPNAHEEQVYVTKDARSGSLSLTKKVRTSISVHFTSGYILYLQS